ncbi:MAG: serine/threonine protein kinase [Burkholderiales bacterium]|nr:serine/threonine protein kinase [Burkholderiales bacterium]
MAAVRPGVRSNEAAGEPDVTIVEFAQSQARRTTLVVLGVLIIIAVALATYLGVKESLRQMHGVNLQSRLDAELRTLDVWVAQRSNVVERWAQDPQVRALVQALVAHDVTAGGSAAGACAHPAATELVALLQPALAVRRFDTFDVIDRGGLIIASHELSRCGKRVSTRKFLASLERSFSGKTSFVRPFTEADRLPGSAGAASDEARVWFGAPVHGTGAHVIAVLGFAEPARAEFATLMRAAGAGESDEIYLFDASGLMLSESRHGRPRSAPGKGDTAGSTMLRMQVRDPGVGGAGASLSHAERSAQPLTRLAAVAIANQESGEPARQRGGLLDPYRNYLGAEVVGAWRWLPQYDFGAALELDSKEAYAPVKFLERAFAFVLALSAAAMVGIVFSLRATLRLRRGLGSVRRLGRYRLIREIGEGGMASIYLGRHALLKRPIAIKILKRALATDEMIARFEREVQAASQLRHPNAIEIYDYGRTRGGDFYYVMEYLDGITLSALVARDGALPAARAVHLLRQVCAALKEAHAQGVVHRDIKPENIMACVRGGEYDAVKILDFGLVKSMRDEVSRDVTGSIKVLGTPAYMAPERFGSHAEIDERADIYSVGAVGYLLIAGRRIFHDASGEDLQMRIVHSPVTPPSVLSAVPLPHELEAVLLHCLSKRPEERPASIAQVMVVFDRLALEQPWSQTEAERWWAGYRRDSQAKPQGGA